MWVRQIRIGIMFGGQGLFPTTALSYQFSFFGISPFHASILKPDFDLKINEKNFWKQLSTIWHYIPLISWSIIEMSKCLCLSFLPIFTPSWFCGICLCFHIFWTWVAHNNHHLLSILLKMTSMGVKLRSIMIGKNEKMMFATQFSSS